MPVNASFLVPHLKATATTGQMSGPLPDPVSCFWSAGTGVKGTAVPLPQRELFPFEDSEAEADFCEAEEA